jgi:hypothetical protein
MVLNMEKHLYSLFAHFKKEVNSTGLNQSATKDNIILREYYTKNESRVFFLSDFTEIKKGFSNEILIYGFWNDLLKDCEVPSDYLILEAGLKLNCSGIPVEIKRIHAGKLKRSGKGSAALKFLEEIIIPELNAILKEQGINEKIRYIYGISAELSIDTNHVSRAKFYSKNGYTLSNSHFYKYLNK